MGGGGGPSTGFAGARSVARTRYKIYPHMYLFILRELHGEVLEEGVLEQLLAGPALARILHMHIHPRLKTHSIKYPLVEKSLGLRICLQNSMKIRAKFRYVECQYKRGCTNMLR